MSFVISIMICDYDIMSIVIIIIIIITISLISIILFILILILIISIIPFIIIPFIVIIIPIIIPIIIIAWTPVPTHDIHQNPTWPVVKEETIFNEGLAQDTHI